MKEKQGFPGGSVVKNRPTNAGDTGSIPGLGRSHMPQSNEAREPQLLSLRALEPMNCRYWSPCAWSLRSATREATAMRAQALQQRSPCSPRLENAHVRKEDPVQPEVLRQINYLKCLKKTDERETERGGSLDLTTEDTPLTSQCLDVICSVALSVLFWGWGSCICRGDTLPLQSWDVVALQVPAY